jgi:septal ring-binding cell division protein DamX
MNKKNKFKQLELFSGSIDFYERNKYKRRIFESSFTLNIEHIIVLLVVILMIGVFSFSLGVERGKKIIISSYKRNTSIQTNNIKLKQDSRIKQSQIGYKIDKTTVNDNLNIYTIQVASFKKRSSVEKEAKKLKNKGYEVLIRQKGKWVVLYVGKFNNKKEAEMLRKKLEKEYGKCLIRSL